MELVLIPVLMATAPPPLNPQPGTQDSGQIHLPSLSMPTLRHFMKRQAWQDLRLRFVISHSLVAGQLYSMLPVVHSVRERDSQIDRSAERQAPPRQG